MGMDIPCLLNFNIMAINPLVGGSLVSAGGSLLGGLAGMAGAAMDYNYQKKLMAQQNAYNQENATIAYNRSRALTQDSAMLEKLGKQQAGINTAFGQNGNVANAASAPQADGTSIPSPMGIGSTTAQLTNSLVGSLTNIAQTEADVKLKDAQTEQTRIDNLTRNLMNMNKIAQLKGSAASSFAQAAMQTLKNKYIDQHEQLAISTEGSNSRIAEADAAVRGQMNKIEYDNKVQDLENKKAAGLLTTQQYETEKKKLSVLDSEISKNYASAADSRSHVAVNSSQARLNDAMKGLTDEQKKKTIKEADNIQLQYEIATATKEDVIKAAKLTVAERGPQSISEWSWKVFNNWDNESGWTKAGAVGGLLIGAVGEAMNGAAVSASSTAGRNYGNKIVEPQKKGSINIQQNVNTRR